MPFAPFALLIAALVYVFFAPYRQAGFEILNGDFAIYPVTADWIRQGHWTPFQVNYDYGGVFLSLIRAAWVELSVRLGVSALDAHASFTHGVIPFILSVSFAGLAGALSGRKAAVVVGVTSAVGFHSWVTMGGVEFYHAYLILGAWLLWMRVWTGDPWSGTTSRLSVLCLGLLSGFAFYTCRASMVFIVAVWVPWRALGSELVEFVRAAKGSRGADRALIALGMFFACFWFYLEWMGPNLGEVFGRKLKVHASPNHQIAALLLLIAWWRVRREKRDTLRFASLIRISTLAALGFLIGLLPELIYWVSQGQGLPLTGGRTTSIPDFIAILGKSPLSMRELVAGGQTVGAQASMLLFLFAIVALIRVRERRFDAVIASLVLALIAYARVYTYDFGPPRYLFPIFPALMVGLGVLSAGLKSKRAMGILLLGLTIHFADQWTTRTHYSSSLQAGPLREEMSEIVARFRSEGLAYVATESHWSGNQFTTGAEWKPFFVPNESNWVLPSARKGAEESARIGLLWHDQGPKFTLPRVRVLHRDWTVSKELGRVGPYSLFVIAPQ